MLDRTPPSRVLDVNHEAWRFLTNDRLADQARAYLSRRGIDVWHLEKVTGGPLAGYTPADRRGLTAHLERRGFSRSEILDSGWASRHHDRFLDRFHRRVLFPVRHADGAVAGVIGRDVTDHARQKYLNTARTVAFCKGEQLYQPLPAGILDAMAVVCEGPLDALAVALAVASASASKGAVRIFPVAPSGTALTPTQARLIAAMSVRDPIVCADGDGPGRVASAKWRDALRALGAHPGMITLPDGHDPASYLHAFGANGLALLIVQAVPMPRSLPPAVGDAMLGGAGIPA